MLLTVAARRSLLTPHPHPHGSLYRAGLPARLPGVPGRRPARFHPRPAVALDPAQPRPAGRGAGHPARARDRRLGHLQRRHRPPPRARGPVGGRRHPADRAGPGRRGPRAVDVGDGRRHRAVRDRFRSARYRPQRARLPALRRPRHQLDARQLRARRHPRPAAGHGAAERRTELAPDLRRDGAGAGRPGRRARPGPPRMGRSCVRAGPASGEPAGAPGLGSRRADLYRRRDRHRVRRRHLGLPVPDRGAGPDARGGGRRRRGLLGDDVRRAGRPRTGGRTSRPGPRPGRGGGRRAAGRRADGAAHSRARFRRAGRRRADAPRPGRGPGLPAVHADHRDHADGEPAGGGVGRRRRRAPGRPWAWLIGAAGPRVLAPSLLALGLAMGGLYAFIRRG